MGRRAAVRGHLPPRRPWALPRHGRPRGRDAHRHGSGDGAPGRPAHRPPGPRAVAAGAGAALAAGYAGLAFAHTEAVAFAAAAAGGAGNGALLPAQSALL